MADSNNPPPVWNDFLIVIALALAAMFVIGRLCAPVADYNPPLPTPAQAAARIF